MVRRLCFDGLTLKKKRFISVLVLLAAFGTTLLGCHSIVQPSRSKLAEMNSFYEGSYRLAVSLDMIDSDFAMQYDSEVVASGERAVWNGSANVYCMGAYFSQDCFTYYDSGLSYKQWRSQWLESDTQSILEQIRMWQELIATGKGEYTKKSAVLSDFHEELQEEETEVYAITMTDVTVDWNSICDVELDLAFGGNDRLDVITQVEVVLLYGTEDLHLQAVILSFSEEGKWTSVCIRIARAESVPEFDLGELSVAEGYLSEEWTLYAHKPLE